MKIIRLKKSILRRKLFEQSLFWLYYGEMIDKSSEVVDSTDIGNCTILLVIIIIKSWKMSKQGFKLLPKRPRIDFLPKIDKKW